MTFSKTYLSALLAIAAVGCADGGGGMDDGDDGGDPPICQPECSGDQICSDEGCQPAFDRDYQVRLSIFFTGKGFEVCSDRNDCSPPYVAVYFGGKDEPILESTEPRVAQIRVTKGSSLGVNLQNGHCALELTADRLRAGTMMCSRPGVSAHLSMVAMPL